MFFNKSNYRRLIPKAIMVFLLTISLPCFGIEVITDANNPVQILSSEQLSSIFLGRMRNWPSGRKITVVIYSHFNNNHRIFCRKVLELSPRYVRQSWDQLTYSGSSRGPIIVSSEEEMLDTVKNTPGSIGYHLKQYEGDDAHAIQID